jgi:hypothetical protein
MGRYFVIFLIGYLVLTAGVAYGLHALGLGMQWIVAAVLIMIGTGIIGSLSRASNEAKDTAESP